jgi:hypothetical protein
VSLWPRVSTRYVFVNADFNLLYFVAAGFNLRMRISICFDFVAAGFNPRIRVFGILAPVSETGLLYLTGN